MIDDSSLPHSMAHAKVARIRVASESSLDELSTKDHPCARPAESAAVTNQKIKSEIAYFVSADRRGA